SLSILSPARAFQGRQHTLPALWFSGPRGAGRNHFFVLTEPLSADAGTNFTVVLAAIWMASPVCGLRPERSARSDVLKLPNPAIATSLPLASSSETMRTKASRLREAAAWDMSVAVASAWTSSVLFTVSSVWVARAPSVVQRAAAAATPRRPDASLLVGRHDSH